ncbi:MAG: monooxygenase, partial [Burkholderiales bacterium]
MRIEIVGGGPSGLFFAYLLKRDQPTAQVIVHEGNSADATYGWGVVFAGHALRFLKEVDEPFYNDFTREHVLFNDMEVVHRGEHVVIRNNAFSRVGRLNLLRCLHRHCQRVGVDLRFESRVDNFDALDAADLVVGTDGVGSRYREHFAARFRPTVTQRPNFFAWYGTRHL